MDSEENLPAAAVGPHRSLRRVLGKLDFLHGSLKLILVWPLACLLLVALLWLVVSSRLDADKRAIEHDTIKDASSLARAYAQHLDSSVERIDQLTLLVKYEWEQSHRALRLEELLQKRIFLASQFAFVTIIDSTGIPITGTLPIGRPINASDRDYFRFHRDQPSPVLHIGKPVIGRVSGKTVIQFTRRLDAADGTFDGVVLLSVEPAYLASFYDGSGMGQYGLLAIVGLDGALRMAAIGSTIGTPDRPALRAIPPLDPAGTSVLMSDAQWFADHRTRFVASRNLKNYPLVALVGLSAEERFAPYRESLRNYQNLAVMATIFLLVFALVATLLSARLAWRKHQQDDVRDTYRLATEGGKDGFFMLRPLHDRDGNVIDFELADCNERGAALSGFSAAEFVGRRVSNLYPMPYFDVVMNTFRGAMETGFYEDELKIPPESPVQCEWVYRRLVRSGKGLAMTMRDISHLKAHEHELSRMANEDPLTGLPNRNWLTDFLPRALERSGHANAMLALLFVDLDDFKNVNDSLGHSAGDALLRAVALRLRSVLRPSDHVIRLGGDEFTVILEAVAGDDDAAMVAKRITDIFDQPFDLPGGKNAIGGSIGISLYPRDGNDAETLLKNSDIAMYHAKAEGKGHFRFYEPNLSASLRARLDTERALQIAIEQRQFVLHYQPRVDTFSGELRGMEALVRWQHPERGMVPPLEFIAIAEQTGLILKLGEIVVDRACAQIAQWKSMDLPLVPISINVSPHQFNHGDIKNLFASYLARYNLDPSLVEIEITESSMMGEEAELASELSAIRALGIKLLVDDFGTGFSSLSQLQRLDMDILKVDRAFTAALGKSTEGEVFFRAIVSMAHALGMDVTAEGVETMEELRILRALSCDTIQGFLIARPVPAEEAAAFLTMRFLLPPSALASKP